MSLADLAWAVEDVRKRLAGYALFRAYDNGEHRLVFATDKYRNTFGDLFREFADNMCDDLVDHMTDRLQVTGWTSPDTDDQAGQSGEQEGGLRVVQSTVATLAAEAWERGRGGSRMGQVFRNAFREGDGFTIVQDGPDGRSGTFRQRPDQMAVRYSTESPDLIDVAAKVWKDGGRYRATLYYPDGSLERYATKGLGANGSLPQAKAFRPMEPGDPALADGEPMAPAGTRPGLGVFHYPNGTISEYGRSLIAKVIPLQDALNKSVADMLVAMEFHAYPQRWATGVQVEYKPDGTERQPFQAGEGRVWRVGDKDAEMGQFDPASMEGFLDVQDAFRLEMARKGAMPPHLVNLRKSSGAPPTGVAMLVAEGRAVKMARDRQRDWGFTLRDQQAYALRLEGRQVEADDLMEQWAPPETRDMKALLEELAMKVELGVPVRQALLEMGYSPEEVAGFMSEREGEDEALEAARAAATGGRRTTVGQAQDLGLPGAPDGDGQANPLAS